jgi:hypothetical protein
MEVRKPLDLARHHGLLGHVPEADAVGTRTSVEKNPARLRPCEYSAREGALIFEVSEYAVNFDAGQWAPARINLSRTDRKIAQYPDGWGVRAELLAYPRWECPSAVK